MNCIEKSEIYSILFVLDNSGSMKVFGDERNQSLNNFIQVQKDNNLKFNFTLTLFSDDVDIIYKNLNSDEIPEIKPDDFKPSGMTSLFDAIGETIAFQEKQNNDKVIFVILTDGLENSSQKYTSKMIRNLISDKKIISKWKFIFLGANQDSFASGSTIGIPKNNCCNFEYSACGFKKVMKNISSTVSDTISGRSNDFYITDKDL